MPIYEYESRHPGKGCSRCLGRFEVFQRLGETPLSACPDCGGSVVRVISWCRAAVVEEDSGHARALDQVRQYEREGRWSHAAELADKHSDKTKDPELKMRALDNYKRAGYDVDRLARHHEPEKG
jgi:putative FmdB family regulatory protein